jgi:hypothetical protein
VNFRFDTAKATEVACLFLEKAGGRLNIMKLVKLIYLWDRLSLDQTGSGGVESAGRNLRPGMIRLGTALQSTESPCHRCVVISDPAACDGVVVLVRVMTDDGTWPDRDCILTPQDWDQPEHASTVAYSTCKFGKAGAALEKAIARGLLTEIPSPSAAVLNRIIAAAQTAPGFPPEQDAICRCCNGADQRRAVD